MNDQELAARLKTLAVEVNGGSFANNWAQTDAVKRILAILEHTTPAEYETLHKALYPPRLPTESDLWAGFYDKATGLRK